MGRRSNEGMPDRFLFSRQGWWHYQRKVPAKVGSLDSRFPSFRTALGTQVISEARLKRDRLEAADNALWASLVAGGAQDRALAAHAAAMRRVEALGFSYRPVEELSRHPDLGEILRRVEAMGPVTAPVHLEAALAGTIEPPRMRISKVYDLYVGTIAADEIVGKSEQQKRKWKNVKKRGIDGFIALIGDIDIDEVTRDHALLVWGKWQQRIAPTTPGAKPTHTASSGNRDIGALRTIYSAYYKHIGQRDRKNPFDDLSFKERGARKRKRPPFPVDWIRDVIMKPGVLATMNEEARGILLAEIETGARPSELVNLRPESIRLDHPVPHIVFEPRMDPDDPRELKTEQSERVVPLVGVALEVFKRFPKGFPRYQEREEAASAAINKFLRENDLMPTERHTLYGLRHSLEDRMKEAGIGDELRKILMGHAIDREEYGEGGSLQWRRSELSKIALPFDPVIVSLNEKAISRRGPARKKG